MSPATAYPGRSVGLALLLLRIFAVATTAEALRALCPCGPVRDILLGIAAVSLLLGLSTRGLAALAAAVFASVAITLGGSEGGRLAIKAMALVALAVGGGGAFSLDALINPRRKSAPQGADGFEPRADQP